MQRRFVAVAAILLLATPAIAQFDRLDPTLGEGWSDPVIVPVNSVVPGLTATEGDYGTLRTPNENATAPIENILNVSATGAPSFFNRGGANTTVRWTAAVRNVAGFTLFDPNGLAIRERFRANSEGSVIYTHVPLIAGTYEIWFAPFVPDPNVFTNPDPTAVVPMSKTGVRVASFDVTPFVPASVAPAAAGCAGGIRWTYEGTEDQFTPIGFIASPYGGDGTYEPGKYKKNGWFFTIWGSSSFVGSGYVISATNGEAKLFVDTYTWDFFEVSRCSSYGTSGWYHAGWDAEIAGKPTSKSGYGTKHTIPVTGDKRETDADNKEYKSWCTVDQCLNVVRTRTRYAHADFVEPYGGFGRTVTSGQATYIGGGVSVGYKLVDMEVVRLDFEKGAAASATYTLPAGVTYIDYLGNKYSAWTFCRPVNGVTC